MCPRCIKILINRTDPNWDTLSFKKIFFRKRTRTFCYNTSYITSRGVEHFSWYTVFRLLQKFSIYRSFYTTAEISRNGKENTLKWYHRPVHVGCRTDRNYTKKMFSSPPVFIFVLYEMLLFTLGVGDPILM